MNGELRDELIERFAADQAALAQSLKISERLGWGPLKDELMTPAEREDLAHTRRVQRENVERLRQIVDEFGWPDQAVVGEEGAEAAWLLAQHADSDSDLQRRCLELMGPAHGRGLVDSEHFAALSDRVALAEGKAQIYATQLEVEDGAWTVRQPCDLSAARKLREQLGLNTVEEAIETMERQLNAAPPGRGLRRRQSEVATESSCEILGVSAPTFIPSLELNAGFYSELVAPILGSIPHSAALVGWGSDVLGFDTERSTDHGWGPRLVVLVDDAVDDALISAKLDEELPAEFRGWPIRYGWDAHTPEHRVHVAHIDAWPSHQLGVDPREPLRPVDWLVMHQQHLLEVTRGAVYHDGIDAFGPVRDTLATFPDAVWRYTVAAQWKRISQEEAFVGRTQEVGDDLGSRIVVSRLVREVTRLAFLLDRTYWPYSKWFGSAFAQLPDPDGLGDALAATLAATDHAARERALATCFELIAARHNATGITEPVDASTRPYFGRPFTVLGADRFAEATRSTIDDPWLLALPLCGSIDQWVDSTDVLEAQRDTAALRAWYESLVSGRR